MTTSRSTPKAAQAMEALLDEMNIKDYEPRVVNQLLDFSYKYISDVLDDARVFSEHAGKKSIDAEDVKLAIKLKMQHCFCNPPPRELLAQIAQEKNSIALPEIKVHHGICLPPDRYCLLQPNYRLKPTRQAIITVVKPFNQPRSTNPSLFAHRSGESTLGNPMVAARVGQPSTAAMQEGRRDSKPSSPAVPITTAQQPRGLFRVVTDVSGPAESRKRKFEDLDEDYDAE